MYEIETDVARHRVTLVLSKDYSHDRDELHRDVHAAVNAVKSDSGFFDMLTDVTDIPVASQERIGSAEAMMKWCIANGIRHSAFAVAQTIQKMQFKRVSGNNEDFRYFDSRRDAERWLDAAFVNA